MWEEILQNYSSAILQNPDLSEDEINQRFPEFRGNKDIIARAQEYHNETQKRGYGMSDEEKEELFPDFFLKTGEKNDFNNIVPGNANEVAEDPNPQDSKKAVRFVQENGETVVKEGDLELDPPKTRKNDTDAALEAFRDSEENSDIFSYLSNYLTLTGKSNEADRLRGMIESSQTTDSKRFETLSTNLNSVYENLENTENELEKKLSENQVEQYYLDREEIQPQLEKLNNLSNILRFNDQNFSKEQLQKTLEEYKKLDADTRDKRNELVAFESSPVFGKYLEIQKTKHFLHKKGLGYYKKYERDSEEQLRAEREVQLKADQGGDFAGDDGITRTLGRAARRVGVWSTGLLQSVDDLFGGSAEYGITDWVADFAENKINPDNSMDPNVRSTTQEKRSQFEDYVEKDGVQYLTDENDNLLGVRKNDITALSYDKEQEAIKKWQDGQIDLSNKVENEFSFSTLFRQTTDAGLDLLLDLTGGKGVAKLITKTATKIKPGAFLALSPKKQMSEKLFKRAALSQNIKNRIGFSAMITARTQSEFYDQAVETLGEEHREVAGKYALAQGLAMGLVNQINPMTYLMGGHRAISKVALDRVGKQLIFNETRKGALRESTALMFRNGIFLGSQGLLEGVEEMTESFVETNVVNKIFNKKITGLNKFEESTLAKVYANDFMIGALLGIAGASSSTKTRSQFQNEIMFQAATSKDREKLLDQIKDYDETGPSIASKFKNIFDQYDEIVESNKKQGIKINDQNSISALSIMESISQVDQILEKKKLPKVVRERLENEKEVLNNRLDEFSKTGKVPPPPPTEEEQSVFSEIDELIKSKQNTNQQSDQISDQQVIERIKQAKNGSDVYTQDEFNTMKETIRKENEASKTEPTNTKKQTKNESIAKLNERIFKGISKDINLITDKNQVIEKLISDFGYTKEEAESEVKRSKGFSDSEGFIFLNTDKMTSSTPLHEYAHPWVAGIQAKRPELYFKGLELVQDTEYMNEAKRRYKEGDSRIEHEALVLAIEDRGKRFLNGAQTASKSYNTFQKWMKMFQDWVNTIFKNVDGKDFNDLTLNDFAEISVAEMGSGTQEVRVRQRKDGGQYLTTFVNPDGLNYTVIHPEIKTVPNTTKNSDNIFNDIINFSENENKGVIVFGADAVGQGESYKYPQSKFGWYSGLSNKESAIKSMTTKLTNAVNKGYNKVAIYVYPKVANAMFANPIFHGKLEQELVDKYGDVLGKYYKDQFVNWQIEKKPIWTNEKAKTRYEKLSDLKRKLKSSKQDQDLRKKYTDEQEKLMFEHKISVRKKDYEQHYKGVNIDKLAMSIAEPDVVQNKGKIVGIATVKSIKNKSDRDRYHGSYNVQIDFSDVKYFYNPVSLSEVLDPLQMVSKSKGYPITGSTADNMIQGYNLMLNHEGNPSVEMLYSLPGETINYQSPEQISGSPSALVSTNPGHEIRMNNNNESYAFKDLGLQTTIDEKTVYNERVLDAITNVAGKINLLDRLGINHTINRTTGYWNELEPSFQITVDSKDPDVNKLVANILGHAFMQDAAISSFNIYKDGSAQPHGLIIQSPDPSIQITQKNITALEKAGIPFSMNQDKNEITVYDNAFFEEGGNYNEGSFESFTTKINGLLDKNLKFVEVSQESELFLNKDYEQNIESILLGSSEQASPEIQKIRERLRNSGLTKASDISKAFNSVLHDNVERVYQEFLDEKGVDSQPTPKLNLQKNIYFDRTNDNDSLDPEIIEILERFKGRISNEKLAQYISQKLGAEKETILSYLNPSPNKNEKQDKIPSEPAPNPENQTDSVKKIIRAINSYEGENSIIGNIKDWMSRNGKKWFSVYGILPKDLYLARERKANALKGNANTIKQTARRVLAKMNQVKDDASQARLESLMSQALSINLESKEGRTILEELDKILPDISEEVVAMRTHIKSMSQTLIDNGYVTGATVETVEKNLETYLNRSYKLYTDGNYKRDNISDEVMNSARNYLFQRNLNELKLQGLEGPEAERQAMEKAEQDITNILNRSESNEFVFNTSSLGKNMDILKRKMSETELPQPIRALMGEYTDPLTQYSQTVFKLSKFIEQSRYMEFMKKDGMGKYLFEKIPIGREGEFTQISKENSPGFKPIDGLYMPNELYNELTQQLTGLTGPFWANYLNLMGWVKWGKTIGSLPTHIKNVYGNIGFMWMNGLFDPGALQSSYNLVKNQMRKMPDPELVKIIERMVKEGVMNQSAALGEVRLMIEGDQTLEKMIDDAGKKRWNKANSFKKGVKKYIDVSNDLYQLEDDFFKIAAYINERNRHAKALFGRDYDRLNQSQKNEVDEIAFEKVRNTLPNYSRVPKAIQFLRISPLLGNFVSFQAESIRTMFRTYIYTKEEINSDNPGIKSIGYKRLASMISYGIGKTSFLGVMGSGAGIGIGGILGMLYDDEDEKDKKSALRDFVAPWSKRSDIVLFEESPGVYTYYDFSSSDPHGYARTLLNRVAETDLTEDGVVQSVADIILESLQPFTELEITFRGAGGLIFNKDSYGKDIINPESGKIDQVGAISEYIYDVIKPGNIAVIERAIAAESNDQRFDEIQTAFTGARPYRLDVSKSFQFKSYTFKKRLQNASKLKYENFEDAQKSYGNALLDFHKTYKNALLLGVTKEKLNKILLNANYSQKERYAIKTGRIPKFILKKPK